jgi:NAD-dependent dihydropyrimidine dehydrogenase PreA subunit
MKRKIIRIDEDKCTGCGDCVPNCPEGAIRIIDGKARLVGDLLCDGLGACLGHCPEGAIAIEERDAEPYDERKVMENVARQGPGVVRAHLEHLRDHGQGRELGVAMDVLWEKGMPNPLQAGPAGGAAHAHAAHAGCPGSRIRQFGAKPQEGGDTAGARPSQLGHWPVQLHLVSPMAPQYRGADVLLSADCVAYALGDFHRDYLRGRALAIACPKLDEGQETYVEKIRSLIEDAKINTLTVMIMEVPCCGGLLRLAQEAARQSQRKIPIRCIVVGVEGGVLRDEWIGA